MKVKTGLVVLGVFGSAYLLYKAKKNATTFVTKTVNPASAENVVYTNTPQPIKNGFKGFYGALDKVGLLPRW